MKIPNPQTLDQPAKFVTILNFIFFLAVFIGIYVFVRQFVHHMLLRILCLLADYFVTALLTYCVIRPLSEKAAHALRREK